jgi:alkylation response protein AidB-like acyl-CoA dehydrogenase
MTPPHRICDDRTMLTRTIFNEEHDLYRSAAREFFEKEVAPFHDAWEEDGVVPRELWEKAGTQGHLAHTVPEEFGGPGVDDFRFPAILIEEQARVRASGPGFSVHSDIVVPYLTALGTEEQKQRWLPSMVAGTTIGAIAMTEPGTGSDLAAIRTTAVKEGDDYLLNGAKTFITNGQLADLVIVVARTSDDPHRGLSLLVVERGMDGFERGRNLDKLGLKAQDTSELFFSDVRVPAGNLLGMDGSAFFSLVQNLPQERLVIAVMAAAAVRRAFEVTMDYVKERTAFGRPIGTFQHNRFTMAEIATEAEIAQVFVDRCIIELNAGTLSPDVAAMAKWWTTELQVKVMDRCLQLHGGYGYMKEYPISGMFADSRVQTIYGGTTEIMKELIGRSLGL